MSAVQNDPYFFIADVLNHAISEEERDKYISFSVFLEDWIDINGDGIYSDILLRKYKFYEVYKGFLNKEGLEFIITLKDSTELHGYWVIFFRVMRKKIPIPHEGVFSFKYASIADFLKEYNYCFLKCDPNELANLFYTANWMAILFTTMEARGNKGLAMSVIPKSIEGFHVKYSTGGGQSTQTSNRVKIYEYEGGVKPHERPTRRAMVIPFSSDETVRGYTNRNFTRSTLSAIPDDGESFTRMRGVGSGDSSSMDERSFTNMALTATLSSSAPIDFEYTHQPPRESSSTTSIFGLGLGRNQRPSNSEQTESFYKANTTTCLSDLDMSADLISFSPAKPDSASKRRKTMQDGNAVLADLLNDMNQSGDADTLGLIDHNGRRMTADPMSIEDVLSSLSSTIARLGTTPEISISMDASMDKENMSNSSLLLFAPSPVSDKSSRRQSRGRRVTADAVDINELMNDLMDDSASKDTSSITSVTSQRRRSSRKRLSDGEPAVNRRVTADTLDIQALMGELAASDSAPAPTSDRRQTAEFSSVQSMMDLLQEDERPSTGRESIETAALIESVSDLLAAQHHVHEQPSMISDLDQSFESELPNRRDTVTSLDLALLAGELDEDHTARSFASVDTAELINSVEAVVGDHTRDSKEGPFTVEQSPVSPRRRSRRLSIKSPTATLQSAVIADVEYNSAQKSAIQALHAPPSALKSCLSTKKGRSPGPSARKVAFGSPSAMEFIKGSQTTKFTPLTRDRAKSLFVVDESCVQEEADDPVTEENSRILEEWDRLSNASGYSSDEEQRASMQPSPRPRRRNSRLQRRLSDDEPQDMSINISADNTRTVNLPSSLLALVRETENAMGPAVVPKGVEQLSMSIMSDASRISEHTHELEANLQSLIQSVAIAPARRQSTGSDAHSSPGLAECNKSWVNITHISQSSTTSGDQSLGPLIGLQPNDMAISTDGSDESSNHFSYDLEISREDPPARRVSTASSDVMVLNLSGDSAPVADSVSSTEPVRSTEVSKDDSLEDTSLFIDYVSHRNLVEVTAPPLPSPQVASIPVESAYPLLDSSMFTSALEPEASHPALDGVFDRLKRLNSGARINSMLQSGTPSVNRSRATVDIMRQSMATSIVQHQETAKKKSNKRSSENGGAARNTKKLRESEAPARLHDKVIEESAMEKSLNTSTRAPLSAIDLNMVVPVGAMATVAAALVDAVVEEQKAADNTLCPILDEIEQLKIKLLDIKKQRKAKEQKKPETPAPLAVKALTPVAEEAIVVTKETRAVSQATVQAVKPARDSELDDNRLAIDILNSLSYCRLRKYKHDEIVVEANLSASVRVVMSFAISKDLASFTSSKTLVDKIHVDMIIKPSKDSDAHVEFTQLFFAKYLCSTELCGPMSPTELEGIKETKDLIAHFRKISSYVTTLRRSLVLMDTFTAHHWKWSVQEASVHAVRGPCTLKVPVDAFFTGSIHGAVCDCTDISPKEFKAMCQGRMNVEQFEALPLEKLLTILGRMYN